MAWLFKRPELEGRKGPPLPSQHLQGRVVEKEETVHQDTGLFGFTTKPQTFRTGGGWFAYNLAANLAQME